MEGDIINKAQVVDRLGTLPQQSGSQEAPNLVCICADCHKIRDGQGRWHKVEDDLTKQPGLEFTHGFCPECLVLRHLEVDQFIKMMQSNERLALL